ncbi:MAG: electron transfer flavoprotein subunit beta/FixA family protein [Bilifractor sp.]|jgi:electron transfer flavoprotein beta subunit
MIKVLVCFTTVPQMELLSEDEWSSGCRSGIIDTSGLRQELNSFDESALELTCRFADDAASMGLYISKNAVTIGSRASEQLLKTIAALGFTHTDRICCENPETLDSESAARILKEYILESESFDLIIMGSQGSPGNSRQTPFMLSEALGFHCISQVTRYQPIDERSLRICHTLDGGECTEDLLYPAVLTIGTVASTYLRVPTLRDRMKVPKDRIRQIPISDFSSYASNTSESTGEHMPKLESFRYLIDKRKAEIIHGTADEQAQMLLQRLISDRTGI